MIYKNFELKTLLDRKFIFLIGFIYLQIFLFSCSSTGLLTQKDYHPAVNALAEGDVRETIRIFPKGEGDTFIPLMEKTYLNLLNGKADIDDLQRYSSKIENRVKYKVSREIDFLFYVKTPEGYYASEHEIIWMHMLLSWGYSLRNDFDKAAIEAKKSALLLEGKSKLERFDDPMIRIILGVLWAMCNRWEDARVDFRNAFRMDPKLKWVKDLAAMESPPKELALMLSGTGPEPYWDPKMKWNPLRGLRDLSFKYPNDKKIPVIFDSHGNPLPIYFTPDSAKWYKRHLERDNEIHNLIEDSQYGEKALYSSVKAGVKISAGVTGGILVASAGIALGGAIIYIAQSGDAVVVGIVIMVKGIEKGIEIADRSISSSLKTSKKELDIASHYRYVRFLPDRAMVVFTNRDRPFRIYSGKHITELQSEPVNPFGVSIHYFPVGK